MINKAQGVQKRGALTILNKLQVMFNFSLDKQGPFPPSLPNLWAIVVHNLLVLHSLGILISVSLT